MKTSLIVLGACAILVVHSSARADSGQSPTLSDTEVRARLAYLEPTLDDGRDYADYWWKGWTAFYSLGVVVEGAEAGWYDRPGRRADYIIGAVKSIGGVVNQLRRPLVAAEGADPIRAMPSETSADRLQQLMRAEDLLRRRAEQAEERFSYKPHLSNVAINSAGALIVWQGFDEPTRAWRSAGIGIAVGELMFWSQPWWPRNDLEEYQRHFSNGKPHDRVSWRIVPTFGGAALQAEF